MLLSTELFDEIVDLLLPHVYGIGERQALFTQALYNEPVFNQIDWTGAARPFAVNTVRQLSNCWLVQPRLAPDEPRHCLQALLTTISKMTGQDGQGKIHACLQALQSEVDKEDQKTSDLLKRHAAPFAITTPENVPAANRGERQRVRYVALSGALVVVISVIGLFFGLGPRVVFGLIVGAILIWQGLKPRYITQNRWWTFGSIGDVRTEMLERVQDLWMENSLYTALRDVPHFNISFGFTRKMAFSHKNLGTHSMQKMPDIWSAYHASEERLLILGYPGIGKSILLQQLTEVLLKIARENPESQIPVVFTLASWSREQRPFREWLLDEFESFYRVHRKVAENWLDNNDLILLLDGLDEVYSNSETITRNTVREKCIAEINQFYKDHTTLRLVVSSRVDDYLDLKEALNLEGAVMLYPLEEREVDAYLAAQGESLHALVQAIGQDRTLRSMSTIPYLLNTLVYVYRSHKTRPITLERIKPGLDSVQRRQKMFDDYIEKRWREHRSGYTYTDTLKYLKWLARKIQAYTPTVFRSEDIEPYWLNGKSQRIYRTCMGTVVCLVIWLLALVMSLTLHRTFPFWIVIGYLSFMGMAGPAFLLFSAFIKSRLFPFTKQLSTRHRITLFSALWIMVSIVYVLSLNSILSSLSGAFLLVSSLMVGISVAMLVYALPDLLKFSTNRLRSLERTILRVLLLTERTLPLNQRKFLKAVSSQHIMRPLSEGYVFTHRYLLESLAGEEEIRLLIQQLRRITTQEHAVQALVRIGEPAVELLIQELRNSDSEKVRKAAADILGQINDMRAVEYLTAALNDKNEIVRSAAEEALKRIAP